VNDVPILNLLPERWRGYAVAAVALAPVAGRAYHALRSGGGLRGVWRGILFGTNSPGAPANAGEAAGKKEN